MKYRIILKAGARKELRKLTGRDYMSVIETLHNMSDNPLSGDTVPLKGVPLWRRRIGDYRIIFSIETECLTVYILRITRRNEKTYRGL